MVSVIVPVYNAGEYLPQLISSVCSQTYPAIELILVDDGSTDGSSVVCDHAAQSDPRIHVIHQKNAGQSAARNAGFQAAHGEIIAFADHDDILHPRMYEYMIAAMDKANTSVCACDFLNVPQNQIGNLTFDDVSPDTSEISIDEWLHGLFAPSWRTPIWNKLYRKEILSDIRFGNLHLGEDNLFSYQVIKKARRTAFVHTPLYFQRMHGNNFEFTGIKHFTDLIRAKEMILRDVQKFQPNEYAFFQKLFLYECIRIYNAYTNSDSEKYKAERCEVIEALQRNSNHILSSSLPIGHKLLITKLRFSSPDKFDGIITI